jgi:tRNA (guanine-N7-)-methyltransferase
MVAPGMRRYRVRTSAQATLVGPEGTGRLDLEMLFGRQAPLHLELGCGHGEFISHEAATHPDTNHLGVEYDRLRVTKCAHKCLGTGATQVRIFAAEAQAFLADRLPDACADTITIRFPDPWPKPSHRRRRLVQLAVLRSLTRIARPGCVLRFVSDTHNYALQVLSNLTLLPGCWRNRLMPAGYAFDLPHDVVTVFERYKRQEGCAICHLVLERTSSPASPGAAGA